MSITVTAVNDAPTSTNDSATTNEDTTLVLGTDDFGTYADIDGDALGAVVVSSLETAGDLEFDTTGAGAWSDVTTNQSITAAQIAAGRLRFVPAADATPYATIGFKVSDGTLTSGAYSLTINVTAVNDAPVAAADRPSQTVQYSDLIQTVTITATNDVDSPALAVSASILNWKTLTGPAQTTQALGGLTLSQVGSNSSFPLRWDLTGRVMVPTGTYVVTVRVADGPASTGASTDIPVTIVVDRESATLEYTGDSFKNTPSGSTNATVTLSAVVREQLDGYIGDQLNSTQIRFTLSKFGGANVALPAECVSAAVTGSSGTGTASCVATIPADSDPYTVTVALLPNGYYTAPPEEAALAVTIPGTGMTSGGGWINEPNNGTKSSFGYTVKRLKNGSVQGNSLYIYRVTKDIGNGLGVRDYNIRVKSNSWQGGGLSLSTGCNTTVTPFSGCTRHSRARPP